MQAESYNRMRKNQDCWKQGSIYPSHVALQTSLKKEKKKIKRMSHIEITKLMEKDKTVLMFYIPTKLLPEFNLNNSTVY